MATLANIFTRFMEAGAAVETAPETRADHSDYRLRALPNEDVYFFVKRIDNSRVVREADPGARAKSWKFLGGACVSAALLIGMLLPSAYGLIASYQMHTLEQEHQRLVTERAALEMEEAKLVGPQRLEELAKQQQFIDPTPERVVYLPSKTDASLAMNH